MYERPGDLWEMKAQHPKTLSVTLKRIKPNENSSVVSDLPGSTCTWLTVELGLGCGLGLCCVHEYGKDVRMQALHSWKERCTDLFMGTAHVIRSWRCSGSESILSVAHDLN